MTRTFQHRVTAISLGSIVLMALVAFHFFWQRIPLAVMVGTAVVCLDVMVIERMLHTSYTFTDDDQLLIYRGRFARQLTIPVTSIIRVSEQRHFLHLVSYVLIEYGCSRVTSVQPDNPQAFIEEIEKRQNRIDKGNED